MWCFGCRFIVCLAVSAVAAAVPATAFAQVPPTTPVPVPRPGDPPVSSPPPLPVPGPVEAEAGAAIGMIRLLPRTLPSDSIFDDREFEERLPRHAAAEFGFGVTSARANSAAYLNYERAIAEAAPAGFSVDGKIPRVPGSLMQTSLPDHPEPAASGLRPPSTPLVDLGLLHGRVWTRWDRQLGPCAGQPIADSRVTLNGVTAGGRSPAGRPRVEVPGTLHARSTVELVDIPGRRGAAVRSTATTHLTSVRLFTGTETRIDVLHRPMLTATSTGDPTTSGADYRVPVLRIVQDGRQIGVLDAAHPALRIPTNLGPLQIYLGRARQQRTGADIQARADMFHVRVLPDGRHRNPAALAGMSFGEQRASASVPEGGINCSPAASAVPPAPGQGTSATHPPAGMPLPVPLLAVGTGAMLLSLLFHAVLRRGAGAHSW